MVRHRWAGALVAAVLWAIAVGGLLYTIITEAQAHNAGHPAADPSEAVVFGSALVSAATVGLVVAIGQRRHPVGWLFLGLGVALAVGGAGDAHGLLHAVVRGEDGAAATLPLVAGQASFIAWFGLLAAILQLTPTGRPVGRRWSVALTVTLVAAGGALVAKAVQVAHYDPPYDGVPNPWAVPSVAGVADAVAGLGILVSMLGLVAAAASLVVRFRRAEATERRQLRWMALVVVPLPLFAAGAYVASLLDAPVLRTLATGGFIAVVPIAAGLSVLRFRLYEVDHILSRAAAYVLSTVALAVVFGVVVAAVGRTLGLFVDDSVVPAVVATVVTVSAAAPLHRRLQDLLDRRFDRRRYEARQVVLAHLGATTPGRTLEQTLAAALHDPSLRIAYWLPEEDRWVSDDGRPSVVADGDIEVVRHGQPVGRIHVDPEVVDAGLAVALASEVVVELDNTRLRAEVASQLEEVRRSRARIVAAQAEERHRIERNLHDGAQQRLLGLAMQLRAGPSSDGDTGRRALLDHAVDELGAAVRELRELANGLRPSALADGGLAVALDDLAGRVPIEVELAVESVSLDSVAEEALWFVACEAVANAVKHSGARRLRIELAGEGPVVRFTCADDGVGGARPDGRGLQGIADRTEAVGGTLVVRSAPGGGTIVEAAVPCAS